MGYHNEHHDLPSIPWNNLPKLRAMAPEFYDNLKFHPSWSRLLFQFIFDKRYSLFSRIERMKRLAPEPRAGQSIVDLGGREVVGAESINV
jgi:fatty acid desaturase